MPAEENERCLVPSSGKHQVDNNQGDDIILMNDTPLSAAMVKYIGIVDKLLSKDIVTRNAHTMLKRLVLYKGSGFFDAILLGSSPLYGEEDCDDCHIDHLDDIIDGAVSVELNDLFKLCTYETAKSASVKERAENNMERSSLTYGEVEFWSFSRILHSVKGICPGGIFYDIGSGSGRAVFTARFTQDFEKCVGIELMPNLHALACTVKDRYDTNFKQKLSPGVGREVEFYCEDLLLHDWSDGDVVFAHSTCFDKDLMAAVGDKAMALRQGSHLVTFSKMTIEFLTAFDLVKELVFEMSWGKADVFIYKRR